MFDTKFIKYCVSLVGYIWFGTALYNHIEQCLMFGVVVLWCGRCD